MQFFESESLDLLNSIDPADDSFGYSWDYEGWSDTTVEGGWAFPVRWTDAELPIRQQFIWVSPQDEPEGWGITDQTWMPAHLLELKERRKRRLLREKEEAKIVKGTFTGWDMEDPDRLPGGILINNPFLYRPKKRVSFGPQNLEKDEDEEEEEETENLRDRKKFPGSETSVVWVHRNEETGQETWFMHDNPKKKLLRKKLRLCKGAKKDWGESRDLERFGDDVLLMRIQPKKKFKPDWMQQFTKATQDMGSFYVGETRLGFDYLLYKPAFDENPEPRARDYHGRSIKWDFFDGGAVRAKRRRRNPFVDSTEDDNIEDDTDDDDGNYSTCSQEDFIDHAKSVLGDPPQPNWGSPMGSHAVLERLELIPTKKPPRKPLASRLLLEKRKLRQEMFEEKEEEQEEEKFNPYMWHVPRRDIRTLPLALQIGMGAKSDSSSGSSSDANMNPEANPEIYMHSYMGGDFDMRTEELDNAGSQFKSRVGRLVDPLMKTAKRGFKHLMSFWDEFGRE